MQECFQLPHPPMVPSSWKEAFRILDKYLLEVNKKNRKIIFFDELPWLATKRSGFVQALDHHYNAYWSKDQRVKIIVCGSAASWMIDKLIKAKGGLYNRLTGHQLLPSFSFKVVKEYLQQKKFKFKDIDILKIYMAVGGIPYYLDQLRKSSSVAENIEQLYFKKDSPLFMEFNLLFSSLFDSSELHKKIIYTLSKNCNCMTRDKLLSKVGVSSGGGFTKVIEELEASGFIQTFVPFDNSKKDYTIRIVDEYTLFYLKWIKGKESVIKLASESWLGKSNTKKFEIWSGFAFEAFCFKHIDEIMRLRGATGKIERIGPWRYRSQNKVDSGVQIDLVCDRMDNVIDIFEMKFSESPFKVTKDYSKKLKNKVIKLEGHVDKNKQIFLTIICPYGLKENSWSEDLVDSSVDIFDLL